MTSDWTMQMQQVDSILNASNYAAINLLISDVDSSCRTSLLVLLLLRIMFISQLLAQLQSVWIGER